MGIFFLALQVRAYLSQEATYSCSEAMKLCSEAYGQVKNVSAAKCFRLKKDMLCIQPFSELDLHLTQVSLGSFS